MERYKGDLKTPTINTGISSAVCFMPLCWGWYKQENVSVKFSSVPIHVCFLSESFLHPLNHNIVIIIYLDSADFQLPFTST